MNTPLWWRAARDALEELVAHYFTKRGIADTLRETLVFCHPFDVKIL